MSRPESPPNDDERARPEAEVAALDQQLENLRGPRPFSRARSLATLRQRPETLTC